MLGTLAAPFRIGVNCRVDGFQSKTEREGDDAIRHYQIRESVVGWWKRRAQQLRPSNPDEPRQE